MAWPRLHAAPGQRLSRPSTCWHTWNGGAPITTDVASSPLTARGACAATRARWQIGGTTLPAADPCDGSWENTSTMDSLRGALLPLATLAKGFRLRGIEARGGCRVMS